MAAWPHPSACRPSPLAVEEGHDQPALALQANNPLLLCKFLATISEHVQCCWLQRSKTEDWKRGCALHSAIHSGQQTIHSGQRRVANSQWTVDSKQWATFNIYTLHVTCVLPVPQGRRGLRNQPCTWMSILWDHRCRGMALRGGISRGWGLTLCLVGALTIALEPKNQIGKSFTAQVACKSFED